MGIETMIFLQQAATVATAVEGAKALKPKEVRKVGLPTQSKEDREKASFDAGAKAQQALLAAGRGVGVSQERESLLGAGRASAKRSLGGF